MVIAITKRHSFGDKIGRKKMKETTKRKFFVFLAIVAAAICAVWLLIGGPEHIEDTNGPDNDSLTQITDRDIIDCSMGYLGVGKSTGMLDDTVKFSSGKFTGVYEVMWTDVMFSTGMTMQIIGLEVNAGNFKMAVVNEGEIIAEIKPGDDTIVDLGDVKGNVRLIIAGESADFSFRLFKHEYDSYGHVD